MAAKYELKASKGGKYTFRLIAGNGEVVLASQVYATKSSAKRGIASIQNNSGYASRFERKKARNGKDYFVLKARNGQVIAKSQMYASPRSMEAGIASVRKNGKAKRVEDPN